MRSSIGDDDYLVRAALAALKPGENGDGVLPPLDELSSRRAVDAVMEQMDRLALRPTARFRGGFRWVVAAAILFMSVSGVALFSYFADWHSDETAPTSAVAIKSPIVASPISLHARIPGSRFAMLFGEVSCGDSIVNVGAEIPTVERIRTKNGKITLLLPSNIAVGLAENSSARVLWDGEGIYGVSLMNGTALFSVDPIANRDGFFVETPAGTIHVTGTLFSVIVSVDNGVFVKLHKGDISIEKPDGSTSAIVGTELKVLGSQKADLIGLNADIDRQLQTMQLIDEGELFTELRSFGAQNAVEKHDADARVSDSRFSRRRSLQDLMSIARSRKSIGDWQGAASSYNELIRTFSTSDEARTSMVSLGQIYLRHLDRPDDALRLFDRYLKSAGPLSQEAMFGKAQAFKSLNLRDREIETLQRFLSLYPTGILAKSVNLRLAELGVSKLQTKL